MKTIEENFFGEKIEYQVNHKDEKHGAYKRWCENGQICIDCTYVNGTIYGAYKLWYNNGRIYAIRQYKNGDRHGIRIEFEY